MPLARPCLTGCCFSPYTSQEFDIDYLDCRKIVGYPALEYIVTLQRAAAYYQVSDLFPLPHQALPATTYYRHAVP